MDWVLIWIVVGLALILVEFFVSGFVIIFFGIAALVTGLALWAGMSADHGIPFIVFAGVSVGSLLLLRSRFKDWFVGTTVLSADADDDFLGHEATIESGFEAAGAGRGKVAYRGAAWDARSAAGPIAKGTVVRIKARHGVVLDVEPI
ncbi:MAG: NfeD family protein [Gammaproteobacteria bacterium]|nr:NfeD family protein [Gammaproteobacteria bacterium]